MLQSGKGADHDIFLRHELVLNNAPYFRFARS
jgi:hypothetical protein